MRFLKIIIFVCLFPYVSSSNYFISNIDGSVIKAESSSHIFEYKNNQIIFKDVITSKSETIPVKDIQFIDNGFPVNYFISKDVVKLRAYQKIKVITEADNELNFELSNNTLHCKELSINDKKYKKQTTDPSKVIYSTYIGGTGEDGLKSISLTNDGFLISGHSSSSDLFLINDFYKGSYNGGLDFIIGKFDKDYKPKWITLIGGSSNEGSFSIIETEDGKVAFSGDVRSGDYPVTSGAFQTTRGGGSADGVLTILDETGNLYYSTFIGGSAYDANTELISDGNIIWSSGQTRSGNFPTTSNAKQKSKGRYYDNFIFKFNINNKTFEYISLYGGNYDESFECITLDSQGNPIFGGWAMSTGLNMGFPSGEFPSNFGDRDGLIVKFDKNTYDVIWGTYIGGSLNDRGYNIACDSDDNVILSGITTSSDFHTKNAFQNTKKTSYDYFISSFDKDGQLNWSTFLGTDSNDGIVGEATYFGGISINSRNEIALSGVVRGSNLMTTDKNLYSSSHLGGEDVFVGIISQEGNLISASYLGGSGNETGFDIEMDENNVYVCGLTTSNDFPITDDAYQSNIAGGSDCFITILSLSAPITCDYDYFYYPNFSDTTNLNIIKDAEKDGNSLFLTRAEKFKAGAVWYRDPVAVRDGFVTTLSFRFTEGYNDFQFEGSAPGADGIAFVVQNHDPNKVSIHGGGIGYKGLQNSVAVELDLYRNDNPQHGFTDANGNHVAIQSMGADENSTDHSGAANLGINNDIDEIKIDGTVYYMMVDYGVEENVMRVWLSDRQDLSSTEPVIISDDVDLHNLLNLFEHHRAYVGVTSSTGTSYQNHELLSWEFCSYVPSKNWTSVEADREIENKVYPNPTQEKATIELTIDRNNKYYLMDLEGRIFESDRISESANGVEVNLKGLANGVYILRVMDAKLQNSKDYKIIKE